MTNEVVFGNSQSQRVASWRFSPSILFLDPWREKLACEHGFWPTCWMSCRVGCQGREADVRKEIKEVFRNLLLWFSYSHVVQVAMTWLPDPDVSTYTYAGLGLSAT